MNSTFKKAYNTAVLNVGIIGAACYIDEYFFQVNQSIDNCIKSLMDYDSNNAAVSQLKGNIFEAWHTNTYNIDSTLKSFDVEALFKGVKSKAKQGKSIIFASPDITTDWGRYGLKDYSNAKLSAYNQAMSYLEYYKRSRVKSKNPNFPSIEQFYKDKGINDNGPLLNKPIYEGQFRLIPSDQLDEALLKLKSKILKEAANRPEQAYRYIETYNNLVDRIKGPNNTESIPLTEEQSRRLTQAIKDGAFNPEDYGLVLDELMEMKYILKQSMNAAISAATLTMVLTLSQQIIKLILHYLKDEKISSTDIAKFGFEIISASGQAFIRGYVAGLITCEIKKGVFGKKLQIADPTVIGTIVAVLFDTIAKSFKLANGSITQAEFGYECMRTVFVASMGLGGAALLHIALPVPFISTLLGNFIGSMIGAFVYDSANMVFLSFCADTGYSFLGFVDQDYELPDEVLKDMGLDIILYDSCKQDECNPNICEPNECNTKECTPNFINTYVIKRGVIGINKIGYIIN